MVNFSTWIPDCDPHSSALLDLFISSDASICSKMAFPPLGSSDQVVVSVSIDFPTYSRQGALFHRIAYDYSRVDWDGLCDHFRDVPWQISLNSVLLLLLLLNFVSGFRFELMYISLIESIWSSLTRPHGFQLLVLLPQFIQIIFFVCTKTRNLLNPKESSDKLVIVAKGFMKLPNLHILIKQESISSQKLSQNFWRIASGVLNNGTSVIPPLFNRREVLCSASDKAKLFAVNFSKKSNIYHSSIYLPVFPSRTTLKQQNLFSRLLEGFIGGPCI